MKNLILTFILFSLSQISSAQENYNYYYTAKILDINNIKAIINNLGNLHPDYNESILWKNPINNKNELIVYQQGNSLLGYSDGKRNIAYSGWFNLYAPGPILKGESAMISAPEDSNKYRIYKVTRNALKEIDYKEWPSEFGAPTHINGEPKFYGDQMTWTVYNSFDHTVFKRFKGTPHFTDSISPLPIEIQQLTFAKQNEFPNTIFFEYTIINKGELPFKNVIFSFWTDIDFKHIFYNFPAIDTTLQLGYCWGNNYDYGIPPAVGYQLLYGPKIKSDRDTALFKGRSIHNYKNLELTSFHGIVDDAQPGNHGDYSTYFDEIWNISRGFESDGSPIINTDTNEPTKFYWTGDPVNDEGWIYTDYLNSTGGGAGFYMFTGPFNIEPNDTQWVMLSLSAAIGKTHLESITNLKRIAKDIQETPYNQIIKSSDGEINYESLIPDNFYISQNYPNPFNAETSINFELPTDTFVKLFIYNSLGQKIETVINQNYEAGKYSTKISMNEFSSGVYFYQFVTKNGIAANKMLLLK